MRRERDWSSVEEGEEIVKLSGEERRLQGALSRCTPAHPSSLCIPSQHRSPPSSDKHYPWQIVQPPKYKYTYQNTEIQVHKHTQKRDKTGVFPDKLLTS